MRSSGARRVAIAISCLGAATLITAVIISKDRIFDHCYLSWNSRRLCRAAVPSYRPWSGEFAVQYKAREIERDLHYLWGPQRMQGHHQSPPGPRNVSQISLDENGTGSFLLPFPFKDTVEMEYTLRVESLGENGDVSAVLMSSPDGNSFVRVKFGTIEVFRDGERVHLPGEGQYQPVPDLEYLGNDLGVRVRCEPAGDGPGCRISVWFDEQAEIEPENSCSVPQGGLFIGFSWNNAIFEVWDLKIRGKLDKHLAAEVLRGRVQFGG